MCHDAFKPWIWRSTTTNSTDEAEATLAAKQQAIDDRHYPLYLELCKIYNKQVQQDRKQQLLVRLDENLDERDIWLGIR